VKIDQTYEVVRLDGEHDPLREHPQNPNKGDDATVSESVGENGWYGAVVAQKSTGYILAGNTRYRVVKKRKGNLLPVIWKDVDDQTALKIMLADNQTARRATMDEEQLTLLLEGLDSLSGTGYDSVLHPLEQSIEDEKEGGDEPPSGSAEEEVPADDDASPPPDVPDDQYEAQYAVMIMCTTSERQQYAFEWLKRHANPEWDIRVVAV
jgi:hypothetical protein